MKRRTNIIISLSILMTILSCENRQKTAKITKMNSIHKISEATQKVRDYVKKDIVIAHRGSTYWAPEETEQAYIWARNIGADYLEMDLQLTKDNQLVAFHDDNLQRTTNIATVFPNRVDDAISDFTLAELRKLDVGSWFNQKNPDRAKTAFEHLKILTLKDIIHIAEGKKLQYHPEKSTFSYVDDEKDNGNRPGIYVETKHPKSNIEKYLAKELTFLGWNINTQPKEIITKKGKIGVANTNARLILQSFSPKSIQQLEKYLPNIPKCFLLWKPDMKGDLKTVYTKAINFAVENNVHIIGPSIAGAPNNYKELTAPWMVDLIHQSGMIIHPYTFDTNEQLKKYSKNVEGVFTNRADLALNYHQVSVKF